MIPTWRVTALIALMTFLAALALGLLYEASRDDIVVMPFPYGPLPACQTEDGSDIDGYCLWTSPRTGNVYLNPTPEEVAIS